MPCARISVTLDGFKFTFVSRTVQGNQTTFCYDVEGNGTGEHDLSNWVLEVCPNNPNEFKNFINIERCTLQENPPSGNIIDARCSKVTTTNPSGNQVNLIGVKFDEAVGKEINDPTVRFCVTFNAVLGEDCVNVGFKAGQDVFQTSAGERINGPVCGQVPPPPPPGEKEIPFCCYVTVPEGFVPSICGGRPIIYSAIVGNCTNICEGTESASGRISIGSASLNCEIEVPKSGIKGCIEVLSALKIEEIEGTQKTFVCCCDCVCVDETLCVACPGHSVTPDNISFRIDPCSLEVTFVDSCVGKSVYKITGLIIITYDCPGSDAVHCGCNEEV